MTTYIDHLGPTANGDILVNWADFTHQRLIWLYGLERAWEILKGRDEATNQDLVAWSRVGVRQRIDTILGGRAQ